MLMNFIGRCHRDFGETNAAVSAYRRALHLEPEGISPRIDIALALMEGAQASEALDVRTYPLN
jgi:cytochrome c-type biogenesis protein CcmH/NrfG